FAPEGGSQRMRDVINKNISDKEITDGAIVAFEKGWDRLKLYFIVGLPTEEDNDLAAIGDMAHDLVEAYYSLPKEKRKRPPTITVSTSCFVPKPFTPFQWFSQPTVSEFMDKQKVVKGAINSKRVSYKYHDAASSVLEGALARGDRRLGALIHAAWEGGARFDGWTEHFNINTWYQAFEKTGLLLDFYTHRPRNYDEILPWDFIDIGVSKNYLIKENERAVQAVVTR
ncbi:MAG: B12-binding domain-containing radical SAM protein, partial [Defluviitaleaceae bacterium]|nr:B12-binding domain-containing radical SAM protein [Defluviitaleaceae bacterium]